jgi:hypothetical protein
MVPLRPYSLEAATGPRLALPRLRHECPALVARTLSAPFFRHPEVATCIHCDGVRGVAERAELQRLLTSGRCLHIVDEPLECRRDGHTLVEAAQSLSTAARADVEFGAGRLLLLNASDVPYRPVTTLRVFLRQPPHTEFVQGQDLRQRRWIHDGLESERFEYYFPFGLQLTPAAAAAVAAGLQWLEIRRWLPWSWISDERAIQPLVAKVYLHGRIGGFVLAHDDFGPPDPDYFTRAGTERQARQLAEVTSGTGLRAHVGTVAHPSFQCRAGAGGDARWQRAAGRTLSFSRRKLSCLPSGRIAQSRSGARRHHFARAAHRLSCARPGASHVATGAAWRQFWK